MTRHFICRRSGSPPPAHWRLVTILPDGSLRFYDRRGRGECEALLGHVRGRGELASAIQASYNGCFWTDRYNFLENGRTPWGWDYVLPPQKSRSGWSLDRYSRVDDADMYSRIADRRVLSPLDELIEREEEEARARGVG